MNIFVYKKSCRLHLIVLFLLAISIAFSFTPIAVYAQSSGTPTPGVMGQIGSALTSCDSYIKMINPLCAIRGAAVWGSSGIIYMTGWFLGVAGVLMNASIELTTIGFDSQIYARIQGGIESVWTAFRDIANIVIIGMFTFIALTMILGIEKFNARQMVAKVLLIAVLINFSLLFTRVIIASSNFVATQFYKAAYFDAQPASSTLGAAFTFGEYSTGISGKFAQLMGIASFADTKEALWKVTDNTLDPGFMTLVFGLFTAIVVIAAALMFFYIAFLLIARAILFIFLLITSSLAFASYLIPGGGFGSYGWGSWWSSLLKNAVFAPLLLMLLWATIQLGTGIKGITGAGTLGGLLVDPAKGGNINALFSYLLILGMLYASIKIASSFASKIGGFDMAKAFAGTPIALGSRFAGVLGRNLIGRGFAKRSEGLSGDIANTQRRLGSIKPGDVGSEHYKAFLQNRLTNLEQKKKTADRIADRKFSLANTDIGKNILQKQLGAPAMAVGGGKNVASFNETQKKTAEEAAKRAVEVTKLSTKDADMVRRSATDVLQKQKEVLEKNVEVAETNRQSEETSRAADIKAHEDEIVDAQKDHELYRTSMMPGGARDMALNQEKVRIETAQNAINDMRKQFRENAGLDKLSEQLAAIDKSIKDTGDLAVGTARDNLKAAGGELARDIAYGRNTNILPWASGGNPEKDQTARKARDTYNKKVGDAGEEDRILEALKRRMGPGSTPPTTPPTP
ncbi:MAG: hypothetical protein AAB908_00540 [Patescibacteria group bacterium]